MTPNQKYAIKKLINGAVITGLEVTGIMMGDEVITERVFKKILPYLRQAKTGEYRINKMKIRGMHGRCFVKQAYRKSLITQ